MNIRTIRCTLLAALCLCLAAGALGSCKEKQHVKSLTEMLRDEEKLIKNFIAEHQINVVKGEEEQKEFDPDTWYKFPNGVYMQVIDSGQEAAVPGKTRVMLRMKGYFLGDAIAKPFDNLSKGYQQTTEFIYVNTRDRTGAVHYQLIKEQLGYSLDELMCEGLAYPLTMVGNGAKVRLLIPFLTGPNVAYNSGSPMYCEEVRYQFI